MQVSGVYFYGNKISEYGIENGYVDYRTFAAAFNHVMVGDEIFQAFPDYWDILGGYEKEDDGEEVFQWFIVDVCGAEILEEAGEIVYYNDKLDIYVWGVTHWGTSWDYVLTDIRCNTGKNEK